MKINHHTYKHPFNGKIAHLPRQFFTHCFILLSPPVQVARWAHMRRFLSVCPSVCLCKKNVFVKFRLDNHFYFMKYSRLKVGKNM